MVSIIVAIYQAEPYLRRCVDSILAQTYRDIEVLLIDDGSTDKSGAICDEYATKDPRVKVFHKANEGVSSTRQFGLDKCNGEFSIHCDPDDWIEPDMIETLCAKATETGADIVMCDMSWDYQDHSEISKQEPASLEASTILSEMYFHISSSLCNKLIRQECYKRNHIRYPQGIHYVEDMYILLELLCHDPKVAYVPQAFYHYDRYTNSGSLTRRLNVKEYKRGVDYIDEHIDHTRYKDIFRLKCDVLFEAYYNKMEKREFRSIYPEIHHQLLMTGLSHPTQNWKHVEVGLALHHLPLLGKVYAKSVRKLSQIKKGLQGRS